MSPCPSHFPPVLAALAIALVPGAARASGACCTVIKSGPSKGSVAVIAATAQSHESIGSDAYTLNQQAVVVKGAYRVAGGLSLQLQAGSPVATALQHAGTQVARGGPGYLAGGGVVYEIPEIWKPLGLSVSASVSHSWTPLRAGAGTSSKGSFAINEAMLIAIADFAVRDELSVYGGFRGYYGVTAFETGGPRGTLDGDREGNLGYLAGVRVTPAPGVSLVGELGLWHTKIASLAIVFGF
ncbi:MAG: hypothetical protein HY897_14825 [Deltaproteobacteria bacterium]|nr:hypothetical protein [Deltaproteobacteria bacterium]